MKCANGVSFIWRNIESEPGAYVSWRHERLEDASKYLPGLFQAHGYDVQRRNITLVKLSWACFWINGRYFWLRKSRRESEEEGKCAEELHNW